MTKQSVGILAAIAVALFAYIAIYERHTLSSGALEGRDNRVAQEYSRHEVGGITIERPDQPTIELVRVREDEDALGHWEMRAPIETMGDDDSIGAMLGSVDWADARRRIAEVSDEDRTAFGLDAPRVTATFRMGNDELVLSVGGETPGGDGVWVTTDGGASAVVAGKDLFEALDHGVDHFRSKRLLARGMLTATELHIGEGEGAIDLQLADGRWTTADGIRAAGPRLDEALQALTDLEAREYFDEGDLQGGQTIRAVREAGEDEGEGEVVVELTLGAPCEGNEEQRYARVRRTVDGETVAGPLACVATRDVEPLLIEASEWRELRPLTLSDLELETMTVQAGRERLTISQDDEGSWAYRLAGSGAEQTGEVDDDALMEWLRAIKGNRATAVIVPADEAALRAHGLLEPTVTITLEATEDRRETVALGSVTSEGAYLRRDDEPAILVVPATAPADFEPSIARLRPRQLIENAASTIDGLAIRRGAVTERLEPEGESWHITAPLEMDADGTEVRALVRELASLQAVRFVSDRVEPAHGLEEPRIDVVFTVDPEDGDPGDRRLRIGRSTPDGAYARLDEDSAVFLVEPDLVERLQGALVPRDLLATSRYEIRRLVLRQGARELVIRNDQGEWVTDDGPVAPEVSDELLGALDHLRAAGGGQYGPPAAADGLTPPRATLTVEREDGAPEPQSYTIQIGAPTGDPDRVHARRADLEVGLVLRESSVEALLSPLQ